MRAKFVKLHPKIPIKKIYWEFHKGDHDFNPSAPHGHSLNGRYKLELWSGCIYIELIFPAAEMEEDALDFAEIL